jgi:pimeloyl-ACP methyl ester carboxylesterase
VRRLGYRELVLLGHSAGGLLAREFVEDHPEAGVTKVLQVCCPNEGCPLAELPVARSQQPFVESLSVAGRQRCLKDRCQLQIPDRVQFLCVVGTTDGKQADDGIVSRATQWPLDLQKQGIPAKVLPVSHNGSVRSEKGAKALAELVRQECPRWSAEQVRTAGKAILAP